MKRTAYSVEIKNKAIKIKLEGYSTREIMDELNVRHKTQIKNWWKWYSDGETYRFHKQFGKQYAYGKGNEALNSEEKLKLTIRRQQAEIDI